MNVQENCIQLKIDTIISEINENNSEDQNEEKNQITALMDYNHCLDLYEFLQIFSKIQKNELLVQIALIYDSIGYLELSLDYINESLLLIPNVPSIILYKSGLLASLNKLDEAQKWLVKYKYLIGDNKYDNYIHDCFTVIFYYLLEYEDNIILRKIEMIENKYSVYVQDNIVLFFVKVKILEKLAQKFKYSDNNRFSSYIKVIHEIKKKLNDKKTEYEILFEQGIKSENTTKILILINPSLLNYKPKKLIEYKKGFNKNGFSLFFTLIKLCKTLKFEILLKKYKKLVNSKKNDKENNNDNNKSNFFNSINDIISSIKVSLSKNTDNTKISAGNESNDENIKVCEKSIMDLCNSLWLKKFINNTNSIKALDKQYIKKMINTNYYIYKGYYSHLNLKDYIIKNIEYNKNYKISNENYDSILNDLKFEEENEKLQLSLDNKNINKNKISKNKSNSNKDILNLSKKEVKNSNIISNISNNISIKTKNKNKANRIKNNLSDIIKKVISVHQGQNNKNKRNKIKANNNYDNKDVKKLCCTDNCNNQILSKSTNADNSLKKDLIKVKSNSNYLFSKNKNNEINSTNREKEGKKNKKKGKELAMSDYGTMDRKVNEEIKNSNKQKRKNSAKVEKNIDINNYMTKKKDKNKENKNFNNKNKFLSTNNSNKKMIIYNINDQAKIKNKNNHNNHVSSMREEKKLDTEYSKYRDVREVNLVSYCLKQLMKKKENKNRSIKKKEFSNLTNKKDLLVNHRVMDFEKQLFQINDNRQIKSKSKKKKILNQSIKKQISKIALERKLKKNYTQKNSDNNLFNNANKSSYSNYANNFNNNMKNVKKSINNYGYKKETKLKNLNYINGNFYSNNNFLNINFNNYINDNYIYSNRHEDKKNFDFKFNPNSDNKKREESYSKDKLNFRTINLDYKNMSIKLNNHMKKPFLNSFVDSKDKNKKSSDNKYDFVMMPLNKIKNSPSEEMNYLKRKLQNIKTTLIKPKTKTSFSKYIMYNAGKKSDSYYFSKSINISEYNKYKNSSMNKSKNLKKLYNKTITNKSISKINNK